MNNESDILLGQLKNISRRISDVEDSEKQSKMILELINLSKYEEGQIAETNREEKQGQFGIVDSCN